MVDESDVGDAKSSGPKPSNLMAKAGPVLTLASPEPAEDGGEDDDGEGDALGGAVPASTVSPNAQAGTAAVGSVLPPAPESPRGGIVSFEIADDVSFDASSAEDEPEPKHNTNPSTRGVIERAPGLPDGYVAQIYLDTDSD